MAQDSENTVVYITEKGQICYDRIEPKDLSTARSHIGKWEKNKDAMRVAAEKNKLWPKSKLRVFFMERNRYENQIIEWANMCSQHANIRFERSHKILVAKSGLDLNR